MNDLPEYIDRLPNICGSERQLDTAIQSHRGKPIYLPESRIDFGRIRSAFAIALHMHQPLIPAGGNDLATAEIISNLKYMMDNPGIGDNHNAPVFHWCYKRMGEFIPQLVDEGKQPRVMLEYSGTLAARAAADGAARRVRQSEADHLRPPLPARGGMARLSVGSRGRPVHARAGFPAACQSLATSLRRHLRLGGAATRPRLFSVRNGAAQSSRYRVRIRQDPQGLRISIGCSSRSTRSSAPKTATDRNANTLPHRLVCRNSRGEEASIIAIIKTQGSDTKLVAQMQPYYEAKGLSRWELAGKHVPPLVSQIADGENGGVMMNEFPPKYFDVMRECSGSDTPAVNVTEYLEYLSTAGLREKDFPALQPLFQKRIWDRFKPGDGPEKLARRHRAAEKGRPPFPYGRRQLDEQHLLGARLAATCARGTS